MNKSMNVVVVGQSFFCQSFHVFLHVENGDSLILLDDFILNRKVLYFK